MSPCLTLPASTRLAQLAEHAFEEEQHDLAVLSLSQLASLGWHPGSDLLRQLMAVSLCSLTTPAASQSRDLNTSLSLQKSIEANGPESSSVINATRLLERIGKLTSYSVLFESIPKTLDRSAKAEVDDEYVISSEERQLEEEEGDGLFSTSAISPSKRFARQVAKCENVWQVFALRDMMDRSGSKAKDRSRQGRRLATQDQREGEENLLCRADYDREAVWRVAEVLLQGWREEIKSLQGGSDAGPSHLARQFAERQGRRNQESEARGAVRPSDNVGEAFEFIFAGLVPTSLIHPNARDGKGAKQRSTERSARAKIAAQLLIELYRLAKLGYLDGSALLRATAELVAKCDTLAISYLCGASREEEFGAGLGEAILMCLRQTAEEGEGDFGNVEGRQEYDRCVEMLVKDDCMPKHARNLLEAAADMSWIHAAPKRDVEAAIIEARDGRSSSEIATLAKQASVRALLTKDWAATSEGKTNRRGKAPTGASWVHLSFAASWKSAGMQKAVEVFHLKVEAIKIIKSLTRAAHDKQSSREASTCLIRVCLEQVQGIGTSELAGMRQCCEKIKRSYDDASEEQAFSSSVDEEAQEDRQRVAGHLAACLAHCESMANEVKLVDLLLNVVADR